MRADKGKMIIIGAGVMGIDCAYCLLNQSVYDELVLIDVNKKRAEGEAMGLNHGPAFTNSSMAVYAGEYDNCRGADIVVICAGVAQKQGEACLDLLKRSAEVFRSIIEPVTLSGFDDLFLVATNPVDVMTRITCTLSGFDPRRMMGTGTALDTARLRYLLGDYLKAGPRNVHAYVVRGHEDSGSVPWSRALLATRPILELCGGNGEAVCRQRSDGIEEGVRTTAYKITGAKNTTYYDIGMALTRITKAILGNEHGVLTVSTMLRGEYGQTDVFAGVPCIINQNGVQRVLSLSPTPEELEKLGRSCNTLREEYDGIFRYLEQG